MEGNRKQCTADKTSNGESQKCILSTLFRVKNAIDKYYIRPSFLSSIKSSTESATTGKLRDPFLYSFSSNRISYLVKPLNQVKFALELKQMENKDKHFCVRFQWHFICILKGLSTGISQSVPACTPAIRRGFLRPRLSQAPSACTAANSVRTLF